MMAGALQNNFRGQMGGFGGMPALAYTSNRYPTKRKPGTKPKSNAGLLGNGHPVGLASNLAGLAYNNAPAIKDALGSLKGGMKSVSDFLAPYTFDYYAK
jgi:hypothetical protein